MSWGRLGQSSGREHWTIYLLATASNLLLAIPLYIAARAGVLALIPVRGSTLQFVSAYGVAWGITLDFLWTLLIFQAILAVLVITLAATSLTDKSWRVSYVFSGLIMSGFVGFWLAARFVQTLNWISVLENSGIDGSGIYDDLFWFGLGAAVFYVATIVVLRKSYDKLKEQRNPVIELTTRESQH
jgi:hypothetical protein